MTILLCPLCSQPRFNNLESLRVSLVNAATQNISCPICNEVLMGLDKLTIHLFGHTLNQNLQRTQCMELKISQSEDFSTKPESYSHFVENETVQKEPPSDVCPTDFASTEHPEGSDCLRNAVECQIDLTSKPQEQQKDKNQNQCTVNMEDLSFLTSWENTFRIEDSKDSESKSLSPKIDQQLKNEESAESVKEDNAEISEYMSDLLNKKLPTLNFVFSMDTPKTVQLEKPVQESENAQFKCSTCDFTFQNSIILSMHQELVHSKSKMEKHVEEEPRDLGQGQVGEPPPAAPKSEVVLNKDVGDVFRDLVLPRYDCHLCSKSFKMKGSLLVHYRVAHLGASNMNSLPVLESPVGAEERNFHCSICGKSFKKEQHLTQHIKTHEGKQWKCETCNKHFTTKYFLKKHQRLHTGEMPYSCQTCHKTFTFQQSYHKHLLYHSDEKPHQCSECGRSFKESSTLHNHQRIHSGEKPFACETCGKCFRQRVSYIVHQRIHTGVLPYQCTACRKRFRYKVSQRSHKCTAQPPGIVVRQPGDLIQRILQHRNDLQCSQ